MNRRALILGGALLLAGAGGIGWTRAVGSMADYKDYSRRLRERAANPTIRDVIRYATLAANSHNTQAWRFRLDESAIDILPDLSRRTPTVDPDDHHLFVSLGCAAENLLIAATATGRIGELAIDEDGSSLRYVFSDGPAGSDALLAAITKRRSTRAEYDGRAVPAATIETLRQAAAMPGVRLIILTDRMRIDQVRDLVVAGNTAQVADPSFRRELKQWLRFNPLRAIASGDGLFSAASGNPVLPDLLGALAFDRFFTAGAENDKYARHIRSSAGIAVFVADREDRMHWIAVGRACQRFALAATNLSLKHAFINQPVEIAPLRPELASLIGENGHRPDIVMRFGYGPELAFSPRRPLEAVII